MQKALVALCASAAMVAGFAVPASASVHPLTPSANLIRNGNAEGAAGSSDGSTVAVPYWTLATGTAFTAVQYGASGFPAVTDPGPPNRGANFFAGGPGAALSEATQQRQLPVADRAAIDAGTAMFTLQGYLGGWENQGDNATVRVDWINQHGTVLASNTIGPVTAAQRNDATGLKSRRTTGTIPAGSRRFLVTMTMTRTDGSYNDGYVDNLTLKVTTPS